MRIVLAVAGLLFSFAAIAAENPARVTVLEDDNLGLNIVAASQRENVAPADPRVKQAQAWLDRTTAVTGEDGKAVAAACERTSRWFFDATRHRATPLEMLEALALLAKSGTPMQDTLRDYIQARRAAAGKSHAEALAAMGVASR